MGTAGPLENLQNLEVPARRACTVDVRSQSKKLRVTAPSAPAHPPYEPKTSQLALQMAVRDSLDYSTPKTASSLPVPVKSPGETATGIMQRAWRLAWPIAKKT